MDTHTQQSLTVLKLENSGTFGNMTLFGEQTLKFVLLHKRPIYVCTQRSQSLESYWDYFAHLTTRMPTSGDYFDNITQDPFPAILKFATVLL